MLSQVDKQGAKKPVGDQGEGEIKGAAEVSGAAAVNGSKAKKPINENSRIRKKPKNVISSASASSEKPAAAHHAEQSHSSWYGAPLAVLQKIFSYLTFQDGKSLLEVNTIARQALAHPNFTWGSGKELELVIMMDCTASMQPYWQEACKSVISVMDHIQINNRTGTKQNFHLKAGLCLYRDFEHTFYGPENVGKPENLPKHIKIVPFTENVQSIKDVLNAVDDCPNGDDVPEDVGGALQVVRDKFEWTVNPHARPLKMVLLVLDAPPHGMLHRRKKENMAAKQDLAEKEEKPRIDNYPEQGPDGLPIADWIKLATSFKKRGITVNVAVCECHEKYRDYLSLFGSTLAEITGGKCILLESAVDLSRYIVAEVLQQVAIAEKINQELIKILTKQDSKKENMQAKGAAVAAEAPAMLTADADPKILAERIATQLSEDKSFTVPEFGGIQVHHVLTSRLSRSLSLADAKEKNLFRQVAVCGKGTSEYKRTAVLDPLPSLAEGVSLFRELDPPAAVPLRAGSGAAFADGLAVSRPSLQRMQSLCPMGLIEMDFMDGSQIPDPFPISPPLAQPLSIHNLSRSLSCDVLSQEGLLTRVQAELQAHIARSKSLTSSVPPSSAAAPASFLAMPPPPPRPLKKPAALSSIKEKPAEGSQKGPEEESLNSLKVCISPKNQG